MRDHCPNAFISHEQIRSSLGVIGRKGAVLLLGAAFLRRVWDQLPNDDHRKAVKATEAFTRSLIGRDALLRMWTAAEKTTESALWGSAIGEPCPCCDDDDWWWEQYEADLRPQCAFALASSDWFVARAAETARRLAPDEREEIVAQRHLYNDIIGPIFWSPDGMGNARQDRAVRELVAGLGSGRNIDPLGLLALGDALEEAGCTNKEILDHCRSDGPHHFGCWALEELAGWSAVRLPLYGEPQKTKRPAPLIPMRRAAVKPPNRAAR
jgi:hypothetical protein